MAVDSFDDIDEKPKKRGGGLTLGKLLGVLGLVLLTALLGVGAFFYTQGLLNEPLRELGLMSDEPTVGELQETEDVFYDFPIMIVTLLDDRGRRLQMLIEMRFVLGDAEHIPIVESQRPALEDLFNYYLREVRIADVRDRALLDRFRQVILADVNARLRPVGVPVRDLLFMDLAMQQQ